MSKPSIDESVKLRRVLEATLLLKEDLDLATLLRHVVGEARTVTGARYGALGVLNDDGTALVEFITVGLERDEEEQMGPRPTGRGVLGLIITDPHPLRMAHIASHPDRYGFPPNHPPMTSFLGVPINVRDEVYGNLYLTDKLGAPEFTPDDEALVGALAVAAGMAIENARLHQKVQEVALFEDRDRMARDLHDTVIQRLFAVGLSLQSMAGEASAAGMADRLESVVASIDDTIRQVRSSIYELGMAGDERGIRANVLALVRSLNPVVGFDVRVAFDGPVDSAIPDMITEHVLATVRESITNIGRHAHATRADVFLSVDKDLCRLQVEDNGDGIEETHHPKGGLGLASLQRRAEKLGGQLIVERSAGGGTILTWQVPIGRGSL